MTSGLTSQSTRATCTLETPRYVIAAGWTYCNRALLPCTRTVLIRYGTALAFLCIWGASARVCGYSSSQSQMQPVDPCAERHRVPIEANALYRARLVLFVQLKLKHNLKSNCPKFELEGPMWEVGYCHKSAFLYC